MATHAKPIPSLPERAVRHRIRKTWERRRAETAGRSEAFLPRSRSAFHGVMIPEVVLGHRELYIIPAAPATHDRDARPERPRSPQTVYVRLVQPR